METLDDLLRLSLPALEERTYTRDEVHQRCRTGALTALFHERTAVLAALDKLAREFETADRPQTARRIRDCAKDIEARLVRSA